MCKLAVVLASLVSAVHGSPPQSSKQASESLALLLLTHKSGAAFHPSGSTPSSRWPVRCSDARAQVRAQSLGEQAYGAERNVGKLLSDGEDGRVRRVDNAIKKMEKDAAMLELAAAEKPELTPFEIGFLSTVVGVSFGAPFAFSAKIVEVLVPTMAAFAATVGVSAEYNGKIAVARGKETGSMCLQAAAEAESFLAQAERKKSVIPLCVGVSAAFSLSALIIPELLELLEHKGILQAMSTQIVLACPIISIIAAAVAALANQETKTLAYRAVTLGVRRFSVATEVGRTWLSASEMITKDVSRGKLAWTNFAKIMLPAPIIAGLFPGSLATKAIVASAVAAMQTAFYLAKSEYILANAMEAVATKMRTAASADAYANQGMRSGSILPFTSALCAFTAASSVAAVEFLPYCGGPIGESLLCVLFPGLGAGIAAAASISKARTEVDAQAATDAAKLLSETPALEANGPIESAWNLCKLSIRNARRTLPMVLGR